MAHHAAEILCAEPGLMIEQEDVEEAVVAGEDGGSEIFSIRIVSRCWHEMTSVSSRKVATNSSKNWVANRVAFEVGLLPVETEKPEGPRHTARHNAELKLQSSRSSMGARKHRFDRFPASTPGR